MSISWRRVGPGRNMASARMTVRLESRPSRSSALKVAPEPARPKVRVLSKAEMKPPTFTEPFSQGRYLLSLEVASLSAAKLGATKAERIRALANVLDFKCIERATRARAR